PRGPAANAPPIQSSARTCRELYTDRAKVPRRRQVPGAWSPPVTMLCEPQMTVTLLTNLPPCEPSSGPPNTPVPNSGHGTERASTDNVEANPQAIVGNRDAG